MIRALTVAFLTTLSASAYSAGVVIKFHEQSGVELNDGNLIVKNNGHSRSLYPTEQVAPQLASINTALAKARVEAVNVFKQDRKTLLEWKKNAEEYWNTELEDLGLYFSVDISNAGDDALVDKLLNLDNLSIVERVEEIPDPVPALASPSFTGNQRYLNNDNNGVHARDAWKLPGGTGNSVKAVDIEGSWQVSHEDMPDLFYNSGSFRPDLSWRNHGTAVVGVMGGSKNSYGITGIAPDARYGVQSVFIPGDFPAAMTKAAMQAGSGGLVIIELQYNQIAHFSSCTCNFSQCGYVPAEYYDAHFQAIKQAVGNGVIVIQAAGNGSVDLDHPDFNSAFDRNVRDSGAIMVGASLSTARTPACFTNYGDRIDVHGWGENVATTGYGDLFSGGGIGDEDRFYTNYFSGTSSASPIVAGSALSVQGILGAHGKTLMDSLQMRALLKTTGEAQTGGFAKKIGKLPNIIKAVNKKGIGKETMANYIDDIICASVRNNANQKVSTICW